MSTGGEVSLTPSLQKDRGRSFWTFPTFSNKFHSNFSTIGTIQKEMASENLVLDTIACWITTILLNDLESGMNWKSYEDVRYKVQMRLVFSEFFSILFGLQAYFSYKWQSWDIPMYMFSNRIILLFIYFIFLFISLSDIMARASQDFPLPPKGGVLWRVLKKLVQLVTCSGDLL